MNAFKIQSSIEKDGELHLTGIPCRKGNQVEVIVLVTDERTEADREAALQQFLAGAKASTFRSEGPYPTRDELHERH